jgi:hypothetical protein
MPSVLKYHMVSNNIWFYTIYVLWFINNIVADVPVYARLYILYITGLILYSSIVITLFYIVCYRKLVIGLSTFNYVAIFILIFCFLVPVVGFFWCHIIILREICLDG